MLPALGPGRGFSLKGNLALIGTIAFVALFLIGFPATRLFFAISVAIGIVVAGILYLWHKYKPVKETDVDNKHPLGLN